MAEYKKSRKVGYAATLKSAPAYSFPKKTERRKDDPGPGPGAYEPSISFQRPRGAGFGTSIRNSFSGNSGLSTPSPIDYNPTTRASLKSAPAYTFGGKEKGTGGRSKTPGPGTYNPDKYQDTVKPSMPALSIAFRPNDPTASEKKPAPNEYTLPSQQFNCQGPAASIKFRHEISGKDPGPGPGEYAVTSEGPAGAPEGKSFGVSRPGTTATNGVPGPAMYDPNHDAVKSRPAAWSMEKSMRMNNRYSTAPGPGTYLHEPILEHPAGHGELSDNRSVPAYTFAGKTPPKRLPDSPAPCDYGLPNEPMRKSAPAYTFRTKPVPEHLKSKTPGPGAYQEGRGYTAVRPGTSSISIAHRLPENKLQKGPAPNAYSLPSQQWDSNSGGVTIKFRHERSVDENSPAPHDYQRPDFRSIYQIGLMKKGKTFGVRHASSSREVTPGPHYKVGCTTLGIAAAEPLYKKEMDRIAVL